MPNRDKSRTSRTLTLQLDETLLMQLECRAAQQLTSVDSWVQETLQEALSVGKPQAPKKTRSGATRHDEAPLDAFLPEGTDPFAPVDTVTGLASKFEEVQARMRFAGTPSLLQDLG